MNRTTILLIMAIIIFLIIVGLGFSEYYTAQPSFCGSCHIMKRYYNTWAKSKHKDFACVECHYAPGEKMTLKAKFKGLGLVFTYLAVKEKLVRKVAEVPDVSCMTYDCHPREKFLEKKYKFTKKIPYIHKTHEEKTIEGQKLHCNTCHQHVSPDKHFEVPKESCYLCHFKGAKFNEGRGKCSLCHEIPKKPLQRQKKEEGKKPEEEEEDEPITHQSLEKKKVACWSCHYELVQGEGEIKKEDCLDCHEAGEALKKLEGKKACFIEKEYEKFVKNNLQAEKILDSLIERTDSICISLDKISDNQKKDLKETFDKIVKQAEITRREIMHKEHVAEHNANCFDCHQTIQHKETEFLDPVRLNCKGCHPDHHKYQRMLLVGPEREGVPKTPSLMFEVKTNCLGCHIEDKLKKGEKVSHGTGKACVSCHKEKHEEMLKKWKKEVEEGMKIARELEKEAKETIAEFKGKVSKETLKEAMTMLEEGQENLRIIEYGGGVHNKKYSLMLSIAAVINFEDLIDLLEEEGG